MIIDPDFVDHWKWHSIAADLDAEHSDVVTMILRIWSHCQQRKSDRFPRLSNKALATLCRFTGDPDALFSSMETHGLLRRAPDGELVVEKWADHNAKLLADWTNGRKGGRPKGSKNRAQKPMGSENKNPDETDKSREDKSREKKGARPRSVDEVAYYAEALDATKYPAANGQVDKFFDHYEANGWRQGEGNGRPIKDWRAAFRGWCLRQKEFRGNGHAGTPEPPATGETDYTREGKQRAARLKARRQAGREARR